MTDALKLAEEALSSAIESHYAWSNRTGYLDNETYSTLQKNRELIRSARAEWGWRPIAEMERFEDNGVTVGRWVGLEWVTDHPYSSKPAAIAAGYTHFCRPQLPPPPAREEVGNAG